MSQTKGYRKLTVSMALDLHDHLLQTPDALLTALLRDLLGEITLGLASSLTGAVLRRLPRHLGTNVVAVGRRTNLTSTVLLRNQCQCPPCTRVRKDVTYAFVALETRLEAFLVIREVGLLVPRVVLGRLVDLGEILLGRTDLVGGSLGRIAGHITDQDHSIAHYIWLTRVHIIHRDMCLLTNLPELPIGNQQGTQGLQTLHSPSTILLGGFLGDRSIRLLSLNGTQALRFPDKFLDQLAIVLAQNQLPGLVDDLAHILDELLAFLGKILRRRRQGLGLQDAVQSNVALLVCGQLAKREGCFGAVR